MATTTLAYYSGDDPVNLPWLSVGAVGFVSVIGHVVADRLRALIDAYEAGEVGPAREVHASMLPVMRAMGRVGGAVFVKAALRLRGLDVGDPRLPLPPPRPSRCRDRGDSPAGAARPRLRRSRDGPARPGSGRRRVPGSRPRDAVRAPRSDRRRSTAAPPAPRRPAARRVPVEEVNPVELPRAAGRRSRRRAARRRARRDRRGRAQHDRVRARGPAADRRLRGAVPAEDSPGST